MGCGCGKNKANKKARIDARRQAAYAEKLAGTVQYRKEKAERRNLIEQKIRFCRPCPHSKPTKEERRTKTRVCHKSNISVQAILNDKKSKCPIGKF